MRTLIDKPMIDSDKPVQDFHDDLFYQLFPVKKN
jgi:hypothetical protein